MAVGIAAAPPLSGPPQSTFKAVASYVTTARSRADVVVVYTSWLSGSLSVLPRSFCAARKPDRPNTPFTRCSRLSNRLNNRLYRVNGV